ncbi:MAG TPA: GNAT family N-acetyltransferase [Thermoanaerobaculia bacterium]|jgi:GNAT superfamily N-acetyltransferase
MISIRRAVPSDAVRATEVARSAKAHWGYPAEWLARWHDGLAIKEQDIEVHPTYVAVVEDEVVGVCQVQGDSGRFMLEHVWVDPAAHGRGVGRALVEHAKGSVDGILHIVADPNAEPFYLKLGAERVGEVEAPMPGAPGRKLPLLELPAGR